MCAVATFVSFINPNLSDNCPFLPLEGIRLSLLSGAFFQLPGMFKLCRATFFYVHVHPGLQLLPKAEDEIKIFFWVKGKKKLAAHHSRRNKLEFSEDLDLNAFS